MGSLAKTSLLAGWTFLYYDPSQAIWMQKAKVYEDKVQCEIVREQEYSRLGKLSLRQPKWTFLWWISPECEAVSARTR